ncbi:unnamed protein product [Calicophoron daubneyi]|uniref:CCZ1/INTU second Longin domain-containing protein n=1 Tax=Calicophoron daubneyi TaxID=300641 RepID=A0AAV2U2N4_CALDB
MKGKDSEYSSFRISDETVSDQIMGSVLKNACDTFELFNGKVSALVSDEGLETLSLRLDHFFSRYLRTMLFEHYDLLDCFNGIQFTAIEPTDFARVEGFLNRIKYAFSSVRYTAFFYDGQLVKSDLDLDYARHLYHYLNSFLFVEQPDLNHTGTASKHKHLGRFLVGPKDLSDSAQQIQCPVLCCPGSPLPDCQLVTYQALRAVVCIVVQGVSPIPMQFFVQFDSVVGPRMTILADKLASNQSYSSIGCGVYPFRPVEENATGAVVSLSALGAPTTVEDEVASAVEDFAGGDSLSMSAIGRSRFVYWNPSTFAILSTMHVYTGSGRRPLNGTKAILDAMASLRCELLLRPYSWHEEITVRLDPYVWIVARRSNGREVYMLFIRKHENLAKLDKYVSRLNSSTFRGLMMLD